VERTLRERGEQPPADAYHRSELARLSWPEVVCRIGIHLADALDYAAAQGVLHRDVKPANVLLTATGAPLLADFNISFGSKLEGASPAAFFGGTLAYMSPEHLDAFNPEHPSGPEVLDARSDLYSLGVMLWELLAGSRPFVDEELEASWPQTLEHMARRRRAGVPAPPADCPSGLAQVLRTCLAPDPAQRFPSGRELARQLALCTHPRAQQLLHPPARGWQQVISRFPTVWVLAAVLWPNLLAALFNLSYNQAEIIAAQPPEVQAAFWQIQLVINGIAFPVGIFLIARLVRPVAFALAELRAGRTVEADRLAKVRDRCLRLGHYAAGVSIAEWLLASLAYPIALGAAVGALPMEFFLHFLASLTLCGLIAAVYPFFGITWLVVQVLYPALLRPGGEGPEELNSLGRLNRLRGVYLLLSAAVPLLAVTALVLIGSQNRFALGVLSAGGLAGCGLAFWSARTILADLQALAYAVHPSGEHSFAESRSFEAF
jgi:hypothetical protein